MSGRLEVWKETEAGMLGSLRVHSSLAVNKALRLGGRDIPLVANEIREEFGWTYHDLVALNEHKLISYPYFECDLRKLKAKYIFPKELREILMVNGVKFSALPLIEHFRGMGLEPSAKTWQPLWKRRDIERALQDMGLSNIFV